VIARSQPLARFTLVFTIVAAVDLLTKQIASVALGGNSVPLAGPLSLVLTHNRGSAFGVSLGEYTWQLNAIATFTALALSFVTVRALTTVDRRAPIALGLIAGAAIGNLTSLLLPPAGVADFLALDVGASQVVLNLADIAAYAGLALSVRSVVLLGKAIDRRRAVPRHSIHDVEVRIPLTIESPALADVPARSRRELPTELDRNAGADRQASPP
jgi:lipoprotein signal peptidase